MNTTLGLSPKVQAFLAAVGGPGVILLILGVVLDDDTLRTVGLSLIGGSAVGGAAGYQAKPGPVVPAAEAPGLTEGVKATGPEDTAHVES